MSCAILGRVKSAQCMRQAAAKNPANQNANQKRNQNAKQKPPNDANAHAPAEDKLCVTKFKRSKN